MSKIRKKRLDKLYLNDYINNMRKVTLKDVAREAGVTPATVSMIINGKRNFKESTIKKVFDVVKKLNYIPDVNAKRLSVKKTNTIAFFVYYVKSGFEIEVLKGIEKNATENDYDILFVSKKNQKNESYDAILKNLILSGKVDGIISVYFDIGDSLLELIHALRFPFVMLEDISKKIDSVIVDNKGGGYQAGKYLFKTNHKRIGLVTAPFDNPTMRERYEGFKKACNEYGYSLNQSDIFFIEYKDADYIGKGKSIIKMLHDQGRLKDFDAFFVPAGDEIAIGMELVLPEFGFNVPNDISIIGYDDIDMAKFVYPALTTIRQDLVEIGNIAFELLHDKMKKRYENEFYDYEIRKELVRTDLIVRDTA